jgi:arsenite-transporting ATPase
VATTANGSFLFFGGKGGVGKTTCAAARALAEAEGGARVLVVSTDPAHSLGDALDARLSAEPRRLRTRGRGRLDALELDADGALERWLGARRRTLRLLFERGTYFDHEDVERFLSLSLPGVDELVALVELQRLQRQGSYERVIVDTAPTGHTLRLLAMPETLRQIAAVLDDLQAKHRAIGDALGGGHRHDAADALIEEIDGEGEGLHALLRDRARAQVAWVTLAETLAVEETRDALAALERDGIAVAELIANRITPPGPACSLCDGRRAAERRALDDLEQLAAGRPLRLLRARDEEPRGASALHALNRAESPNGAALRAPRVARPARAQAGGLALAVDPGVRLLLFGGKGGVGKTTCAAAAALALAARGPGDVLVLSTDPAHSLGDALGVALDDHPRRVAPGLLARELDAARALAAQREDYRAAVDELFDRVRGGSRFDAAHDRRVAQDLIELTPPGVDELFALLGVMDSLESGAYRLVVVDTAPTGHALRLLAMPGEAQEWVRALLELLLKYRDIGGLGRLAEDLVALAGRLRRFGELLHDGRRARFVAVTRPAALPALETMRLAAALGEAGVALGALLVNAVTPDAGCLRCRRAAAVEREHLGGLARLGARGILRAPAVAPPPRGVEALLAFARSWQVARTVEEQGERELSA